jgi:hypothetical protein
MVTDLKEMEKTLDDHNYKYLNMTTHVFEGDNHSTAKDKTYQEGIKWVFDQDIQIPTSIIAGNFNQQNIVSDFYPNPVVNTLNIIMLYSLREQFLHCKITTISGKEIKSLHIHMSGQPLLQIPVAELSKGLYIIQLSIGKDLQTLKFVKQ